MSLQVCWICKNSNRRKDALRDRHSAGYGVVVLSSEMSSQAYIGYGVVYFIARHFWENRCSSTLFCPEDERGPCSLVVNSHDLDISVRQNDLNSYLFVLFARKAYWLEGPVGGVLPALLEVQSCKQDLIGNKYDTAVLYWTSIYSSRHSVHYVWKLYP